MLNSRPPADTASVDAYPCTTALLQCFWQPLRGALVVQPSHYCMTLAEQRVRNKPDQRNVWLGSRTISSFSGNARLPSQTFMCARLLASGLQDAGLQKHVRCTKQHHVHGCIGNYLHAHLLAASSISGCAGSAGWPSSLSGADQAHL